MASLRKDQKDLDLIENHFQEYEGITSKTLPLKKSYTKEKMKFCKRYLDYI